MADALQQVLGRVGGARRAAILGVGVAVAALIFTVSRWATAPDWVPAFTGQPIETVSQMTDKLQQAGIEYRLDRGGSDILVNASDVARARVTLAKDGLPASGRPGLELFDQPSWGMTDFTQRINYRRALEGELERTIGKMRGVQGAQVHLALHEQSNFRQQDRPANASVVLKVAGETPAPDVVQGIQHLVASSVDGLTSARVAVLDDSGRLLSSPGEDGSGAALTNQQLAMQREVESYLQAKAEGLVNDIVGSGNARVRVTAALNFDRVERQSELVDPEKQATSTEQRYDITPGPQGGAASSNVATSYDNSKVTESFSGAIGNLKRLSVAVLLNDRMIPPTGAAAKRPDAKPTYEPRSAAELARVDSLVRSAVGADSARGDIVTVIASRFDGAALAPAEPEAKPGLMERAQEFQKPAISVLSVIALLVTAVMVLKALKSPGAATAALGAGSGTVDRRALAAGTLQGITGERQGAGPGSGDRSGVAEPLVFAEHASSRGKITATIAAKPDVSARVVRAWLKEA